MVAMAKRRANNAGTFDKTTKTWRNKGKGIQRSTRQLEQDYGVKFRAETLSELERESAPIWRRYQQDVEDRHYQAKKAASPLQTRIKSLEAIIRQLRQEHASEATIERLEAELRQTIDAPHYSTDYTDLPVHHPQTIELATRLGMGDSFDPKDGADDAFCTMLEAVLPRPQTPATKTLRNEADHYLARLRSKNKASVRQPAQAVELLLSFTKDIPPDQVTVYHWRAFYDAVQQNDNWNDRTKPNIINAGRAFLRRVETDHNLRFGFLNNNDYKLPIPEGKKIQYTLDQVKTALQHATGNVRTVLLLSLNTGLYWSDFRKLTPEKYDGVYLTTTRSKNEHRRIKVQGTWYLWEETRRHLKFDLRIPYLQRAYSEFAEKHGLPSFKALRKTTPQLIQDHYEEKTREEAGRLFRCEGLAGTHGKNYVRSFSEPQVKTLEAALRFVATLYGIS